MKEKITYLALIGFILSYSFNFGTLSFASDNIITTPYIIIPLFWILFSGLNYWYIQYLINKNKSITPYITSAYAGILFIIPLAVISYSLSDLEKIVRINLIYLPLIYFLMILINFFTSVYLTKKPNKLNLFLSSFAYYSLNILICGIIYFIFLIVSFMMFW